VEAIRTTKSAGLVYSLFVMPVTVRVLMFQYNI